MIPEITYPHFWGLSERVSPTLPPLAGPFCSLPSCRASRRRCAKAQMLNRTSGGPNRAKSTCGRACRWSGRCAVDDAPGPRAGL